MMTLAKIRIKLTLLNIYLLCIYQYVQSTLERGTIWIVCDDYLNSVSVNGVEITDKGKTFLSGTTLGSFLTNISINPGDMVTISCSNEGGPWTNSNPAAIIATIRYFDEFGATNYFNTGTRWLCNSNYPMIQVSNFKNSIYPHWQYNGGPLPMIKGNAYFLWSQDSAQNTTCSAAIPRKSNAKIFTSVDDILVDIKVNGESIPIYGDIRSWNSLKNIDAALNFGDIISITGENSGNAPWTTLNCAGILATIYWKDDFGKMNTIKTGAGWTCDGAAPMMQGPNMSRYADLILPSIASDAQWIWGASLSGTSTCSYTIPKS